MFVGMLRGGAAFGGIDPHEERSPPPEPTAVNFPKEPSVEHSQWDDDRPPPSLQALFSKVVRPGDISDAHVAALNFNIHPDCPIEDLVPLAPDGTSFIPSAEPVQAETKRSYSDAVKSDTDVSRKRKAFDERYTELELDNDLAFRALNRTVQGPGRPPRLAFLRKFWEGLENMSRYWDCSLDRSYTSHTEDHGKKSPKRQRVDSNPPTPNSMAATPGASPPASISRPDAASENVHASDSIRGMQLDPTTGTITKDELLHVVENFRCSVNPSADPDNQPRKRYKGRRTSNGSQMPENFRNETVQGFVEGAVWSFQTLLSAPRVMPRVRFDKLVLPIRQTAAVYRVPLDKIQARRGWMVGPIMGIQTRPETDFVKTGPGEQASAARLDLLREFGVLLQLAQERNREGKVEVKPGEGMWWTTKPRWGGGAGGDPSDEIQNVDVLQAAEELLGAARDRAGGKYSAGRLKKTPALLWKEVKCGKGYWDPKTEYEAIGKEPDSAYDQVFLVSSINHHISVVKLTVHSAYLDYLESSALPTPSPEDPNWCRPKLERSRWYDLFEKNDRLELFRGLWGVMTYLMRGDVGSDIKTHPHTSAAGP